MEEAKKKINNSDNFIENDRIKLSVLIVGALIFVAYMRQYIYYNYFGVDISNYMGIDEVFTPFLDDLTFMILILVMYILVNFFMPKVFERVKHNELQDTSKKGLSYSRWEARWMKVLEYLLTGKLYFIGLPFLLFLVIRYSFYGLHRTYFLILASLVFPFIFILAHLGRVVNFINTLFEDSIYKAALLLLLLFIIILNLFSIMTDIEDRTKYDHKKITYKFVLQDRQILTDSLNVYLGRTQSDFFIYNQIQKKVTVYKISDVEQEEIVKLPQTVKEEWRWY